MYERIYVRVVLNFFFFFRFLMFCYIWIFFASKYSPKMVNFLSLAKHQSKTSMMSITFRIVSYNLSKKLYIVLIHVKFYEMELILPFLHPLSNLTFYRYLVSTILLDILCSGIIQYFMGEQLTVFNRYMVLDIIYCCWTLRIMSILLFLATDVFNFGSKILTSRN